MNMINKVFVLFAAVVVLSAVSGCRKAPDPKDPQQVAEAFWSAVIAGNYDEAEKYVIPEARESFRTEAIDELKGLPAFPDQPQIKAKIDGSTGTAIIENWEFGMGPEMVLQGGKWWIDK